MLDNFEFMIIIVTGWSECGKNIRLVDDNQNYEYEELRVRLFSRCLRGSNSYTTQAPYHVKEEYSKREMEIFIKLDPKSKCVYSHLRAAVIAWDMQWYEKRGPLFPRPIMKR